MERGNWVVVVSIVIVALGMVTGGPVGASTSQSPPDGVYVIDSEGAFGATDVSMSAAINPSAQIQESVNQTVVDSTDETVTDVSDSTRETTDSVTKRADDTAEGTREDATGSIDDFTSDEAEPTDDTGGQDPAAEGDDAITDTTVPDPLRPRDERTTGTTNLPVVPIEPVNVSETGSDPPTEPANSVDMPEANMGSETVTLDPAIIAPEPAIEEETRPMTTLLTGAIDTSLESVEPLTHVMTEPLQATVSEITGIIDETVDTVLGVDVLPDPAGTDVDQIPTVGTTYSGSPDPLDTRDGVASLGIGAILLAAFTRWFSVTPNLLPAAFTSLGSSLSLMSLFARAGSLRFWGWRVVSVFRYSRHDDSDPLAHEGRSAVYERIDASPGIHLSALSERTGTPLSTVRYHLRVLEYEGLVTGVKVNGKRRFYHAHRDEPDSPRVPEGAAVSVIETLANRGPLTVSALAAALDRDPSTITYHLQRLADAGFVTRNRDGRAVINRLSPETRTALATDRFEALDLQITGNAD